MQSGCVRNIFRVVQILFITICICAIASATVYSPPSRCGNCSNGTAATVNINYTFTGLPGTNAGVSNIGTASNALLDFTIPQGSTGPIGPTGPMNQTPNMTAGGGLDTSWNLSYPLLSGTRTLTGIWNFGGYNVSNLSDPISAHDAATRNWTLSQINSSPSSGGSPAGSMNQVIYNVGGNYGGDINLTFDNITGTLHAYYLQGNITGDIDTQLEFAVKEGGVGTLYQGQAVYISGSSGTNPLVLAANNTVVDETRVVGLITTTIAKNGLGNVLRAGMLYPVDTRATNLNINPLGQTWAAGDLLFLTTGGGLTNIRPTSGRSVKAAYSLTNSGVNGRLLAYPFENPVWITAASGEGIVERLGDNSGATNISIRNYSNNQVAYIDSLGNAYFNNSGSGSGSAINTSYFFKPGLPGGQSASGGSVSGDTLTLNGTINGVGNVLINPLSIGKVGINTNAPNTTLDVFGVINGSNIFTNTTITRLGIQAGYKNSGTDQTAIGYFAGQSNTGLTQTAIGSNAGNGNTANVQTVLGAQSGYQNSGGYQSAFGGYAGYQNSGTYQSAFGGSAGYKNIAPNEAALGYVSGYNNTGANEAALGCASGYNNTGANQNAIGYDSGRANSGNNVTSIGYYSGYQNTGDNGVFIGSQSGYQNALANQFILKQANINSNPLISGNFSTGIVTFNNYGAGTATFDANGTLSSLSDPKYKKNIKISSKSVSSPTAVAAIQKVVPITFQWNDLSGLSEGETYLGFNASNLLTAIPEAVYTKDDVTYNQVITKVARPLTDADKGVIQYDDIVTAVPVKTGTQTLTVNQGAIIAVLVDAIQEQQARLDYQQAQIDNLTASLNKGKL